MISNDFRGIRPHNFFHVVSLAYSLTPKNRRILKQNFQGAFFALQTPPCRGSFHIIFYQTRIFEPD